MYVRLVRKDTSTRGCIDRGTHAAMQTLGAHLRVLVICRHIHTDTCEVLLSPTIKTFYFQKDSLRCQRETATDYSGTTARSERRGHPQLSHSVRDLAGELGRPPTLRRFLSILLNRFARRDSLPGTVTGHPRRSWSFEPFFIQTAVPRKLINSSSDQVFACTGSATES